MTRNNNRIVLFWFRRDLRLTDNTGLAAAARFAKSAGLTFTPIFVFDPEILKHLNPIDSRVTFIWNALEVLKKELKLQNIEMLIVHGKPLEVFQKLHAQTNIQAIYSNHDYEPAAIFRDESVRKWSEENQIQFQSFKDQVIFEKNEVLTDQNKPYTVYTPYKKKWLQHFENVKFPNNELDLAGVSTGFLPTKTNLKIVQTLEDFGFKESELSLPERTIKLSILNNYATTRDFPSDEKGTSRLGVHLRFGTVSTRTLAKTAAREALKAGRTTLTDVWLSELIWREFFMLILFHYPGSESKSFKPQYEGIKWRDDEIDFLKWKNGETGYPIIDAGMRELVSTGHMHNRVRMATASFLCKHLLHHWKSGERFFAEHLLDYDLSANVGNWQWSAGTGCDAAPYFRIFNPYTQAEKFDPNNEYIKKWVPEFTKSSYQPMVDHAKARERCLTVYKAGLS